MKERIFTFWEPKENLPAYIKLCMQTWEKFLPDYEITLLDYSNLNKYLDKKIINRILCKKTTLPKQADCIRVALLYLHGGIWLDADTIITRKYIGNHSGGVSMIGIPNKDAHLAFISASASHQKFISLWLGEIYKRVKIYKILSCSKLLQKCLKKQWKCCANWDYFGNAIISPLIQSLPSSEINIIDRDTIGAFPEHLSKLNKNNIEKEKLYRDFYFRPSSDFNADDVLENNNGIILLHNSWTPAKFKNLSAEDFLQTNIPLAQILRKLLCL